MRLQQEETVCGIRKCVSDALSSLYAHANAMIGVHSEAVVRQIHPPESFCGHIRQIQWGITILKIIIYSYWFQLRVTVKWMVTVNGNR